MHNAPLSFLIYLLYFKNSQLLNHCELDPCVYDDFDSISALELNLEVVTLTLGTFCIFKKTPQTVKYAAQSILPGVAGADTSLTCSFGKSTVSGIEAHGKMCHLSRCATKQSASFTLSSLISQNYNLVVYC